MFNQWIQNLTTATQSDEQSAVDLQRVSTQLLLEVARADTTISADERNTIIRAYGANSTLSADEISALIDDYAEEVDISISFHEHIRAVNENFDKEKKVQLIRQMWQVAYADQTLSEYEEAFIRQVAELIHVRHKDFIQQKLAVLENH